MTTPQSSWPPRTEEALRSAADSGLLKECHSLDIKRELKSGDAANRELAKDIAAFALEGGTIFIGVDEDSSPPSLHAIELKGLAERIEGIAETRLQEGVSVRPIVIESTDDPNRGYVVVEVPASPRAPHMVDYKYYGRGETKNRVLSNAEVRRLHEQQIAEQRDILAKAHDVLTDLMHGLGPILPSMMVLLAEPLGAGQDLLVPLTEPTLWQPLVLELIQASAVPEHQQFRNSLATPQDFVRRPGGVAATTGMQEGLRFGRTQRAAELLFCESGTLMLASEWPVTSPAGHTPKQVVEATIIGHTDLLVRLTPLVSQRFGFAGSWRFGLVISGLRGAVSIRLWSDPINERGPEYLGETYEDTAEASLLELGESPQRVVHRLVSRLLRSLGSHQQWEWLESSGHRGR